MKIAGHIGLGLLLALGALSAVAGHAAEPRSTSLEIQLVSIDRGNRESSFGDDPPRFQQTAAAISAKAAGVDLRTPSHPRMVFSANESRLFYLFYNDVSNARPARYLIQRIKRSKTRHDRDGRQSFSTDYQVEAIKTLDGRLRKPDQHFGSYSLQGAKQRQIVKEYEIGIGEIEGVAAGTDDLFDPGKLYELVQRYQTEPGKYAQVKFRQSFKWNLTVALDEQGNYELRSPELGIEIVRKIP